MSNLTNATIGTLLRYFPHIFVGFLCLLASLLVFMTVSIIAKTWSDWEAYPRVRADQTGRFIGSDGKRYRLHAVEAPGVIAHVAIEER